jgi:hypothetical protein
MTPFKINITLLSPTAPGSGEGRAGVIDREVVSDDLGLPIIPARRLKGVLLEAACEVQDVLAHFPLWCANNLINPSDLFGRGGQSEPGPFLLGDALLKEYDELQGWVQFGYSKPNGKRYFHPEAVLAAFSEQRFQTAMDPQTGGPLRNTLRVTRLLRSNLEFTAAGELHLSDPGLRDKALRTLCLACHALRRMGLSRNRGPGHIRVTLECASLTWTSDQLEQELESAPLAQETS